MKINIENFADILQLWLTQSSIIDSLPSSLDKQQKNCPDTSAPDSILEKRDTANETDKLIAVFQRVDRNINQTDFYCFNSYMCLELLSR